MTAKWKAHALPVAVYLLSNYELFVVAVCLGLAAADWGVLRLMSVSIPWMLCALLWFHSWRYSRLNANSAVVHKANFVLLARVKSLELALDHVHRHVVMQVHRGSLIKDATRFGDAGGMKGDDLSDWKRKL